MTLYIKKLHEPIYIVGVTVAVVVVAFIVSIVVVIIAQSIERPRLIACRLNQLDIQCSNQNCKMIYISGNRSMYNINDQYVGIDTYYYNKNKLKQFDKRNMTTCDSMNLSTVEIKTKNKKFIWMNYTFATEKFT